MNFKKPAVYVPLIVVALIMIIFWPIISNEFGLLITTVKKQETTEYTAEVDKTIQASVPSSTNNLALPPAATVLTLVGLDFNVSNYMPDEFQGRFSKSPYVMKEVKYPASTASDSITKGVANLDLMLKLNPGPKIVMAHSQGAQVASRWMREHADDPKAPSKDTLTFLLLGNPLRSTGGYIIGRKEVGGTIGQPTPTDTPWRIIDVARRYEGWADWPRDESNKWAVRNADAGKRAFHTKYNEVNLLDPASTVWTSGNTTFVLTKEDLPLWQKKNYPDSVVADVTSYIDSAYRRPTNYPVTRTMDVDLPYWKTALRIWGVPSDSN